MAIKLLSRNLRLKFEFLWFFLQKFKWIPAGLQATKNGVWEKVADKEPVQIFTTSSDGSYAIWDMRPPPVKKSMTQLKKKKLGEQDALEVDPWAHLNLVWKPLLKATLSKGENGSHRPSRYVLASVFEVIWGHVTSNDLFWAHLFSARVGNAGHPQETRPIENCLGGGPPP
jgi:hypothetical protein